MAAIVWADVVALEPLVAGASVDAQTTILAYVNTDLNVDGFGGEDDPRLKLARSFVAAHYGLSVTPGISSSIGGGPVASLSGGDGLAVSFAVPMVNLADSDFATTTWGRKYISLVRRTPGLRAWIIL
jgi:hypothetical protein